MSISIDSSHRSHPPLNVGFNHQTPQIAATTARSSGRNPSRAKVAQPSVHLATSCNHILLSSVIAGAAIGLAAAMGFVAVSSAFFFVLGSFAAHFIARCEVYRLAHAMRSDRHESLATPRKETHKKKNDQSCNSFERAFSQRKISVA